MIAMRTLSTMYWAAGWIRNIFQKFGEKQKNSLSHRPSAAPTRASSPSRHFDGHMGRSSAVDKETSLGSKIGRLPGPFAPPPTETDHPGHGVFSYGGTPGSSEVQNPPMMGQTDEYYHWNNDTSVAGPNTLAPFARDSGFPTEFPVIDYPDFTDIDPDLADCWQDLLAADNPFNNSFLLGNLPR